MKPFNLEEAIAGKPLVTRAGKRVTQFCYFKEAATYVAYSVHAHIEGNNYVSTHDIHGRLHSSTTDDNDLMMFTEKQRVPFTIDDIPLTPFWVRMPKTKTYWESVNAFNEEGLILLGYFGEDRLHPKLFTWKTLMEDGWFYAVGRTKEIPFYKLQDI